MFSSKFLKDVFMKASVCNLCKNSYLLRLCKWNHHMYIRAYNKCISDSKSVSINFQQWILQYFKKTDNYSNIDKILPSEESNLEQKFSIKYFSDDELLKAMINTYLNKNHKMRMLYDDEWYYRVEIGFNLAYSLKLLNYWVNLVPSHIKDLKTYHLIIYKISQFIKTNEITRQQLIEYVYFVSLMKNDSKAQSILKSIVARLAMSPKLVEQFTLEEMCIFCNSLFTTSTRVFSPVLLDIIISTIERNIDVLLKNPAFLTALIKPLRHARYYNYNFLDHFTQILQNVNIQYGDFLTKVHLLALYSDAAYSNEKFINAFCCRLLDDLEYCVSNNTLIRMKDVNRFLWCVSNFGFTEHKPRIQNLVIPYMLNQKTRIRKEPSNYLNSLLWLMMLQCETEELVQCMLIERHLDLVLETKHIKNMVRAGLLISAVQIQYAHLVNPKILAKRQQLLRSQNMRVRERPHLASVLNAISCLSSCLGIHHVELCWKIPGLYFSGISIQFGSSSAEVEVLDNTVCLHNTTKPLGLMQFKLKLMQAKGYNIILIENSITNMDTEQLYEHVEACLRQKIESSQYD